MEYIISSSESSEGTILENDTMAVLDGGVANSTTVYEGDALQVSSGGTAVTIDGMDYLLTNENNKLSVTVKAGTPVPAKWTYLVYMAADSDLCQVAIYDIVAMQQARIDPEIEVYILVDRTPVGSKDSGDYVTPHGTYKWDSLWPDTRVGKITYSSGLTVTVDWESWGELDTGSIDTLKRFVDWAQEQSPAENYGLIMWDHGGEGAELCWDLTTNPKWEASLTISEVSSLLKEKGNVPLVIFNNCLLGSEITVTQMAGSTEVIVASEPMSYSESTFNYNVFFNTITADMTAQEMAQIMVLNMESSGTGITTMLSSVDVTVPRLAAPLEALAGAVAASGNPADRSVLINAMLKAPQDGCLYDGSDVQQSDLGFLLTRAMEDSDYENTSEGFKKALLDVMAALNESVLEFRSIPAGRGSGIAFCNTVCTIEKIASDSSPEKANAAIKSHITSYYKSNPLWGGLLYDLGTAYLAENEDKLFPVPTFTVRDVEGLVKDRIVSVSDFGCFSGLGESFAGIKLIDEFFFSFTVTAADKSTGKFRAEDEDDAQIAVSLLAPNGTVIATGTDGVSFENLAPGEYFVRLQSDRNCRVTVDTNAEFKTGVDRFDYAGSGKNEKYANGNGSIAAATVLAEGFYDGLITYVGDTDYYLIGDIHTERYKIVLEGEAGLTVEEYDRDGTFVRSAEFKDGKYTLTMDSMDYLLVEGVDELEESLNAYSFSVIGLENGSGGIVLDGLCGTKDEVSWISSTIVNDYDLELSMDDFGHVLQFTTAGTAVDLLNLPAGTYQWRVGANVEGAIWYDGDDFISDNTKDEPKVFQSGTDASDDLFFATPNGTWGSRYCAKHVGTVDGWEGTGELVSAAGKGRIQDLFFGSADPGTLFLTDSENGDALFLDDAYTGLPEEIEENTARLCRLRVIRAGAGDDIIDMTSQQFEYLGGNISLCGGDGDDIIWAGNGKNTLYGDAGNDRLVGASGDDVIVGGIGNDAMHGGGGNDVFTFCDNWGMDTVEQLETGKVTLWFASGSKDNWNADELMYDDGKNSVTVFGVSADQVTLKFGSDKSELYETLSLSGAFNGAISQRIFDLTVEPESNAGFLAEG